MFTVPIWVPCNWIRRSAILNLLASFYAAKVQVSGLFGCPVLNFFRPLVTFLKLKGFKNLRKVQNFLSLWLNAGTQITHGGQVRRWRFSSILGYRDHMWPTSGPIRAWPWLFCENITFKQNVWVKLCLERFQLLTAHFLFQKRNHIWEHQRLRW